MKFVRPLFDFSFSQFITTKIVRILYALAVVGGALLSLVVYASLVFSAEGFIGTIGALVVGLPLAALVFFVNTAFMRIVYELIIVLFRIAENVQVIASSNTEKVASGEYSAF